MNPPISPVERERNPGFNGRAIRLGIASSCDYVAHPLFPEQVEWKSVAHANNVLCYTKKFEMDGSPMAANLVVVGVVSSDRPYLGDLGNWNGAVNMNLCDIKQQFTLERPTKFPEFEADFDVAVRCLKALQGAIAEKGSRHLWFILEEDMLRMSHRLFQDKLEVPDESSDMEDHEIDLVKEACIEVKGRALASKQYPIKDRNMQEPVNKLLVDYDLIPLEAYDRTNTLIPTNKLSRTLKGALVQVIFNLHSNYIAFQKVTNFRGQIVQVKVLKNSTRIPLSPRAKGPIKLQTAQLRRDQVEAVNKFLFPKFTSQDGLVGVKDEPGSSVSHNTHVQGKNEKVNTE